MDDKPFRDLVLDFVSVESGLRRAGSYIHSTVKAVNSWRKHHGRPIVVAQVRPRAGGLAIKFPLPSPPKRRLVGVI